MHQRLLAASLAALIVAGSPGAGAAPSAPASAPAAARDTELAKAAGLLAGSWKTTGPVPQFGGEAGATAEVVMHVAPVTIGDVPNAFLVEQARADALHSPYRHAVFQLYRFKDKLRLRTYEFIGGSKVSPVLVGMWAAPEAFPVLTRADLIATLDVELAPAGDGFKGRTPYPYPTGVAGAVEMTSEVELSPGKFVSADRGFGPDGSVVWGSEQGSAYTFAPFTPPVHAHQHPGGLVVIDFAHPEGQQLADGDQVTVHYSGWLVDGTCFDTTRQEGREPFTYTAPGSLIEGWKTGMAGATPGTRRRLIIPPQLGYGDRSAGRGRIPANSTLYFDIECLAVQTPPPQPESDEPK